LDARKESGLATSHQSDSNRLLSSLPPKDRARIEQQLEPLTLNYRQVLYRARQDISHVYFLDSGVASLVNTMKDGKATEVGTVGNEGIVGVPILLGDSRAPTSMYMQVPGKGRRMPADVFRRQLRESETLPAALLHYTHTFFNQVAQSAACNHFHKIEQRCCRWLLMTHDRMQKDEFLLTQEFLTMMLGVRRASVTNVMSGLKTKQAIEYHRGLVVVRDRKALEKMSCECYAVSKAEFDRLLDNPRLVPVA
jgi:CRP-like cAMP-binding protein